MLKQVLEEANLKVKPNGSKASKEYNDHFSSNQLYPVKPVLTLTRKTHFHAIRWHFKMKSSKFILVLTALFLPFL